tara:strand:+ start:411 stop:584 length:174 start_codon:yes stop_codon:yes gene_type:complete
MSKIIKIADAIISLNSNAVFYQIDGENIEWLDGTNPISIEDIKAEQQRLQDIEDAKS